MARSDVREFPPLGFIAMKRGTGGDLYGGIPSQGHESNTEAKTLGVALSLRMRGNYV